MCMSVASSGHRLSGACTRGRRSMQMFPRLRAGAARRLPRCPVSDAENRRSIAHFAPRGAPSARMGMRRTMRVGVPRAGSACHRRAHKQTRTAYPEHSVLTCEPSHGTAGKTQACPSPAQRPARSRVPARDCMSPPRCWPRIVLLPARRDRNR